jgi:hypothetical protein
MSNRTVSQRVKQAILVAGFVLTFVSPWIPTHLGQGVGLLVGLLMVATWDGWWLTDFTFGPGFLFALGAILNLETRGAGHFLFVGTALVAVLIAVAAKKYRSKSDYWARFEYLRKFRPAWRAAVAAFSSTPPSGIPSSLH